MANLDIFRFTLSSRYKIMRNKAVGDLINFFREVIAGEKRASGLKRELTHSKGFSMDGLFRTVAKEEGQISIQSMKAFVKEKIACNDREVYELFEKFDHRRCGVITEQDFGEEVGQIGESRRKREVKENKGKGSHKRRGEKSQSKVVVIIEVKFLELLQTIIKTCRILDTWRTELSVMNPYILFQEINRSKTGRISLRELTEFFITNEKQLNQTDANILYHSLLLRHLPQPELNLQLFCLNLKPLEFGYYPAYKHSFDRGIHEELISKERIAKQAVEIQENYLKERRNKEIVELIHHEAGLSREKELEKRVQDEIRAYQELRYLTSKRFRPGLGFQEFLRLEKENEEINVVKMKLKEEEEMKRQAEYREMVRHVQALGEVQKYEGHKIRPNFESVLTMGTCEGKRKLAQEELEKRIRSHTFSVLATDDFLTRAKVQRDMHPTRRML